MKKEEILNQLEETNKYLIEVENKLNEIKSNIKIQLEKLNNPMTKEEIEEEIKE